MQRNSPGNPQRIVVVGGGLAGHRTVMGLRERGFEGEVVLVGSETHLPYDRPPLSKKYLLDPEPHDTALPLDIERLRIGSRLGVSATGVREGILDTSDGELPFDGLVIATGSTPIRLPATPPFPEREGTRVPDASQEEPAGSPEEPAGSPEEPAGSPEGEVHYLRTKEDAAALREALRPGATVVIVGAGWIGAEVATAAARHECAVTVIEQAATPVSHALPAEIGSRMTPWYAAEGIDLRLGVRVATVGPRGVHLEGGEFVAADAVVVGVGVRPATAWLESSPIELDRGVVVNAGLRTNLPGVYACGDVAARWSPRYNVRVRGEHWDDALRSPMVAVANLLDELTAAGDAHPQVYDPVPYVWSEQFGRMVQYAGVPGSGVKMVERGDDAVIWLNPDDTISAVLTVDKPRDFVQARKLAEQRTAVNPQKLADPGVTVRQAVAGSDA